MTAPSSTGGTNGLTVAVVTRDPIVRSLLVNVLRECRIPVSESALEELARAVAKPGVVCTDPLAAAAVLALNVPTVIVTRGLEVSDQVWAELVRRRPVVIRDDELTPVTLLEGLVRARIGIDLRDPPSSLSWVPPALLRAFVAGPRALKKIADFARVSRLSREQLRAVEEDLGCGRFENVAARLRADMYRWLVSVGVDRTVVEEYLGIEDRSHFRRACRSAGAAVPWSRHERA